ncbi:MAG: hypothetical protein D6714_11255 [Bacteroidetes bacterium]|nr:MAG: hypothetical protein D6714_11255 [Bacteroidota bacterium]
MFVSALPKRKQPIMKDNILPADTSPILRALLALWIIAIGFTEVWVLPVTDTKVQPPEIIFILLLLFVGVDFWKNGFRNLFRRAGILERGLFLYLAAVCLSAIFNPVLKSWLEVAGILYLLAAFGIYRTYFSANEIYKWLIVSGLLASLLGVLGWVLTQSGINNVMAWSKTTYYPYFGYIGRAKGFTPNPNMLMSIVAVIFLLKFSEVLFKKNIPRKDFWVLGILLTAGILTFAKTFLALLIAVIFVWVKSGSIHRAPACAHARCPVGQFGRSLLLTAALGLFLVLMTGAHIAVFPKNQVNWEGLKKEAYTEDHPFYETRDYYFIWTNYMVNKRSATLAGLRNPLFGVGPGGHNAFVAQLKKEGRYPSFFSDYDPHSTYFGAWGELGLAGLAAVLFLALAVFRSLRTVLNELPPERLYFGVGLAGAFLYLAIEAITTDILNFRHVWLLFVLLSLLKLETRTAQTQP